MAFTYLHMTFVYRFGFVDGVRYDMKAECCVVSSSGTGNRQPNSMAGMRKFDRRDWLTLADMVTGATVVSRRLLAGPRSDASGAADRRLVRLSLNENPFGPAPQIS
jgi:hypothetical protein